MRNTVNPLPKTSFLAAYLVNDSVRKKLVVPTRASISKLHSYLQRVSTWYVGPLVVLSTVIKLFLCFQEP